MKEWFLGLELIASIMEHIIPIVIVVITLVAVWVVKVYFPQLKHIALVAEASDAEGIEALACYLATNCGGKHILTRHLWDAFIPAAVALREDYEKKLVE